MRGVLVTVMVLAPAAATAGEQVDLVVGAGNPLEDARDGSLSIAARAGYIVEQEGVPVVGGGLALERRDELNVGTGPAGHHTRVLAVLLAPLVPRAGGWFGLDARIAAGVGYSSRTVYGPTMPPVHETSLDPALDAGLTASVGGRHVQLLLEVGISGSSWQWNAHEADRVAEVDVRLGLRVAR